MIKRQTAECLKLLESDLHTLSRLVITHRTPVTEGDIRAASAILRRWSNEGLIGQLCNELGVTPSFPVLDNQAIIDALPEEPSVTFFLTGGVNFNGTPIMAIYHSAKSVGNGPILLVDTMITRLMNTGKFLRQKRVLFEGGYFTCEDIITFTANKLGGVHLDFDRNPRQAQMERAAEYMTFGGPPSKIATEPPGEIYLVVEPDSTEILSGFHVEIIAAAASLLSIHFDGKPLVDFTIRRSLWHRLTALVTRKKVPMVELHDFRPHLTEVRI
ncbi:hypothetical protein AB4Y85_04355 [Microvirga sp. 2YAF29]|uniref:hypothetical protein n=1 Tax=Microvirga sp. 2YAF29 TaxID=3233031 RepID=UPI003F96D2B7